MTSAKRALTQAIENKVQRLDMDALVKLAVELQVPVPTGVRAARTSPRPQSGRGGRRQGNILSGSGIGPVVSAAEGSRILDAITIDDNSVDWAQSELIGAGELVQRLEISRGTLDNWRKANKIVAFRKGLRNYVYPVRQFERLKPVGGLDLVAAHFTSSEEAWEWLVAPNRITGLAPPIEALREGDVAAVVKAAEGAHDFA
jgi:hypothetical protein